MPRADTASRVATAKEVMANRVEVMALEATDSRLLLQVSTILIGHQQPHLSMRLIYRPLNVRG